MTPSDETGLSEVREELLQMAAEDQGAARASYEASQRDPQHRHRFLFDIPRSEWLPEYERALQVHARHLERLRRIVGQHGWPDRVLVGREAARAAWLLAQHAGAVDRALQRQLLAALRTATEAGRANPEHLAALADRVELEAGRLQTYGTHLEPDGETWKALRGVRDEEQLDTRRLALGLKPWDQYLQDCLNGVSNT